MNESTFALDLSDLQVSSIDVLSADSITGEGHSITETGASSSNGYCSSYLTATSCWSPER
jgi:hypothetical protein